MQLNWTKTRKELHSVSCLVIYEKNSFFFFSEIENLFVRTAVNKNEKSYAHPFALRFRMQTELAKNDIWSEFV